MKKMKEIIRYSILSVITLAVGYAAFALPVRLLGGIDGISLRWLFVAEVIVYVLLGFVFLAAKERKAQRMHDEKEKRLARREKFQRAQEEYYNLAA